MLHHVAHQIAYIYAIGSEEEPLTSLSSIYRALDRPPAENRSILDHDLFPTRRDAEGMNPIQPRRELITLERQRQSLLAWEGNL